MSQEPKKVFIPVDFCVIDKKYYLKGYTFASEPNLPTPVAYYIASDFEITTDTVYEGFSTIPAFSVLGYTTKYICPQPFNECISLPRLSLPGVRALGEGIYQIFAPKYAHIYDTSNGVWLLSCDDARFITDAEFQGIKDNLQFGNYNPETGTDTDDSTFNYPFEVVNRDIYSTFDLLCLTSTPDKNLIIANIKEGLTDPLVIPDNVHIVSSGNSYVPALSCPKHMIACDVNVTDALYAPETCNFFTVATSRAIDISLPRIVTGISPYIHGCFSLSVPKNEINLDMSLYRGLKTCTINAKTLSEDSVICLGENTCISLRNFPHKIHAHAKGLSESVFLAFVPDRCVAPECIDVYLEDIDVEELAFSPLLFFEVRYIVHLAPTVHIKSLIIDSLEFNTIVIKSNNAIPKLELGICGEARVEAPNIELLELATSDDDVYSIPNVTQCHISLPKKTGLEKVKPIVYIESAVDVTTLVPQPANFVLKNWG